MTEYDGLERSSATEILRRGLDERGVEYEAPHAGFTIVRTDNAVCKFYETLEEPERGVFAVVTTDWLTPEQAIAATLGRGECKVTNECKCSACGWQYPCSNYTTYTTCDGRTAYRPSWRLYNDCGRVNFCPNCGRRVTE